MENKQKVILIIRDGWGHRKECKDNAICETNTPNTDRLMKEYPNTLLKSSGEAVGLPKGCQGNSEVGHMTIGSGRIIYQSLKRINNSINSLEFFQKEELNEAIDNCIKNGTDLHLIGLLQTEGVHSHIEHLFSLLDLCKKRKFENVFIHAITDGRDAPVNNGIKNIKSLLKKIKEIGFSKIVTLSGRYYAMDRDKRWDRTKIAYNCIVNGKTKRKFKNVLDEIKENYNKGITDEFIVPVKKEGYSGFSKNDSVIFFNFRTDRTRQLTKAIVEKNFNNFEREYVKVFFVAMTHYYEGISAKVVFKDLEFKNILGEVISNKSLKQLRISETEKYAHVTFFFNGQNEKPYKGEERILIPSPKVATYDQKPEMSAFKITKKLVSEIKSKKYDFIVVNLVNCDMVGHTGKREAIKKAIETVDECVGTITDIGLKNNYSLLIFADHGNAEDLSSKWGTSHTINPVQFIFVSDDEKLKKIKLKKEKGLKDIAPTVLDLMKIKKPKEMTGESLLNF